ncbi:hypothetical protein DM01DRAFT_1339126 [Hesseltinella vesiculosa]|uniref:Nuclear protein Es2 n=1 Tax=Hesseltinella vesiculosa TaxID=101127 RepID=A0A1X2G895_9FUNG|nr:hypothetical protein DM01DRAFT_1339126 [Hesseltinella vesiculosa]
MDPTVLDEDTYTDAISFIIERDFYPQLAKIKAHNQYQHARIAGDQQLMKKASQLMIQLNANTAPHQGLQNFYHPEKQDLADRVNLQLNLDQFQSVYTSEDNASFNDLLEKTNAKRKDHYRWYYDKNANQLRIQDLQAPNLLMYYPQGESRSLLEDADNGRRHPKAIQHANTSLDPPSTQTYTPTVAAHPLTLQDPISNTFRGYGLVESTPLIDPSTMDSPLMTWGEIEGTPIQIKGSDTPGRQFTLPKQSLRDQIGMKLSEKASKAYRQRTNERRVRGTPRLGSGLFSPAAQHLLRKSTPQTQSFDSALRSSYAGHASKGGAHSPYATRTPLFRAAASTGQPKK